MSNITKSENRRLELPGNPQIVENPSIAVGGQAVFDALKSGQFYVWEVGKHYYLWIDHRAINIENPKSLYPVLYKHHFLYSGVYLDNADYRDFVDICRKKSLSFDLSVRSGITPEQTKEYRLARRKPATLKAFFASWVLKNCYPTNTL